MDRLRDCLEEMVKFTLDSRADFDLGFTGDFCSGLLVDGGSELLLPADSSEACTGVPEYPLYKRLVFGLLNSIASGFFCGTFQKLSLVKEIEKEWDRLIFEKGSELVNALKDIACELHVPEPLFLLMKEGLRTVEARCFEAKFDRLGRKGSIVLINKCLMFEVLEVNQYSSFNELLESESPEKVLPNTKTVEEGLQMLRTLYDMEQEKINGVVAIHLTKTVPQPCATLAHILSGLSYSGVQSLLGLSQTIGSILDSLPPPKSMLLSSFMLPYNPKIKGCRLSHGARALAKHVDRSSDGFWGGFHGTDLDKNRVAEKIVNRFLENCCWMNIHVVSPHGDVFEIRVANGYGARWSKDGTKFIGFLEPYMENGHSMGWKH